MFWGVDLLRNGYAQTQKYHEHQNDPRNMHVKYLSSTAWCWFVGEIQNVTCRNVPIMLFFRVQRWPYFGHFWLSSAAAGWDWHQWLPTSSYGCFNPLTWTRVWFCESELCNYYITPISPCRHDYYLCSFAYMPAGSALVSLLEWKETKP